MKRGPKWEAARGPLQRFRNARFPTPASARTRRRAVPGRGSDGLPFASLRVPCDARVPGLWPNSLRSLRSLRSNRRPQVRLRSALRARPGTLRFSAAPIRPAQAPPAALPATQSVFDAPPATTGSPPGHPGRARRACEALRSTGLVARARSALRHLTRRVCPSAVSEANEASYAAGPQDRAPQGSRSEAKTASPARRALPGCPVAAPLPARRKFIDSGGATAAPDCSVACGAVRAVRGGETDMNFQHRVTRRGRAPSRPAPGRVPPGMRATWALLEGLT